MAVVRIKATKKWHLNASEAMLIAGSLKAARELRRAAERRGLTAELHGNEVCELACVYPEDELAIKALKELRELEAIEATRPRARDIAMGKAKRVRDQR